MTPDELKDWLEARPEETRAQEAAWIASRAAARVLPVLFHGFDFRASGIDLTCLHASRSVLVSGLAGLSPTPAIKLAASSASLASARAADAIVSVAPAHAAARTATAAALAARADTAALAATAAGLAVDVASDVIIETLASVSADARFLSSAGHAPLSWPLWPQGQPERLVRLWDEAKFRVQQGADGTSDIVSGMNGWGFWVNWFEDLLEGRPQNGSLLSEVSEIPDDDWSKGPTHVNAMIARLVKKHAVEHSFIAEQIERNVDGLFTTVPVADIDGDILANLVAKVADRSSALRASIASDNNALTAVLPVLDDLDDTIARFSGNALRLHDDFREAHYEISALLTGGELSPDRLIDRLQRSLETGALDCEGNSEACTRAVQTRVNARALNLSAEDQAKLRAVSQAAQTESDADLRRDLADDLEVGLDTHQSKEKRANAMKREGSRLIRIKEKMGDPLNALNDTAKTVKSVDTVWSFVGSIWHWFI